ncbi:hypothetical protein LXL04_028588 [Taraxacum kok-saghyz]
MADGAEGFFDDINAMFFLVDEMPPSIGEYMSIMLFESDEDQPLEDESDEDWPTEKEGDEGADLDEDDLVDEENNVPEVEVDMADFTLNLDRDESEVHIDGGAADEEVDEGLDVIDNERWDSLYEGYDDDMRRINVLKNLGKEKRCNLGNVHKASFYVGQKFKSKKELKDLIDAHAIQTRRNLYFEENDKLRLRAKCRGVVVGSLSCGREILGFDGAFMKGPFPGQVLTAVGLDSNNGIYPVAYAIVESENIASWKWFLDCLGHDLDLGVNSNFTFITDRQKGIIPAICSRFPHGKHRFYIRHIYQNMKKLWKPTVYKDYLWKCATATTIPDFEHFMSEFSFYDKAARRTITDILLNNLCEVFNSKLIDGRDKPIISCLEYIRHYLMKRICYVMKVMDKAT